MANTFRDTVQAANYIGEGSGQTTRYPHFEGLAMLPMANATGGNAGSLEVVRLHAPVRTRVIQFDWAKSNTPPLIPKPAPNGNEYIVSSEMVFELPTVMTDNATLQWHATGTHTYIEKLPWDVNNGYAIGDYPFQPPVNQLYGIGGSVPGSIAGGNTQAYAEALGNQATFVASQSSLRNFDLSLGEDAATRSTGSVPTPSGVSPGSPGDNGTPASDYSTYTYNIPTHYPSNFLSDDMGQGT